MFYFIGILIFFGILFKFRNIIYNAFTLYRKYKNMIDPENKISHIKVIKNISVFFFTFLYQTYNSYYLYNTKKYSNYTNQPNNSNSNTLFNKKYIKISYTYKDKPYFYLLKIPKGVPPLISITDEEDNDIYDIIYPYLGPNLDCHKTNIYPKDFGYSKIKITTAFDKLIIFEENQKIDLTD
jgi:hypothetical protein